MPSSLAPVYWWVRLVQGVTIAHLHQIAVQLVLCPLGLPINFVNKVEPHAKDARAQVLEPAVVCLDPLGACVCS